MKKTRLLILLAALLFPVNAFAQLRPIMTVVDLGVNEEKQVRLCDGSVVTVKLLEIRSERDSFDRAVRKAYC